MKKTIYIFILLIINGLHTILAQNTLKGRVSDSKNQGLAGVKVWVEGNPAVNASDENGNFTINSDLPIVERPKAVKVQKSGYLIKEWKFKNNQLDITLIETMRVKGRVVSATRKRPLAGVRVILIGIRGLEPVKTNNEGFFELDVPRGTVVKDAGQFQIFDPGRLNSTADYDVKVGENGLVYLEVDVPPRKVAKIQLFDENNRPLKNETVLVDGRKVDMDAKGEAFAPEGSNDFSNYVLENLIITKYEYVDLGNVMKLHIRKPLQGEKPNTPEVSTVEERKEAVVGEKAWLDFQNRRINEDIEAIEARLRSGKNISAEERQRLEERLSQLRAILEKNREALDIVKEKAENVIAEISKEFKIQKELTEITQQKLLNTQLNVKLANERYWRNISLVSIIALAIAALALLFFVNNRKINFQKEKLSESVDEINLKNAMLEESARLMDIKNKQINEKNEQLTEQTQELELKNAKITDSIRYAYTIQRSIFPSQEQINEIFKDSFIFYEPKDIVSGDFYWLSQKGDEIMIVAADCTGHGVPGALMTMLGSASLNQLINEKGVTEPAEVLRQLNENIINFVGRDVDDLHVGDGMDLALLKINPFQKTAVFAGAKLPIYYVSNGELIELKPTNLSIGVTKISKKGRDYENQYFNLNGDEIFYMASDGFQDQLGGIDEPSKAHPRRKYMRTRMLELIRNNYQLPFNEQQALFQKEFKDWKGENDQTDDVLVFSFKV
jgi:serine phosphatase RsbU (regulator of sigma subunit)